MKSILKRVADLRRLALGASLGEAIAEEISVRLMPEVRVLIVHSMFNIGWARRIAMDLDQNLPGVLDGMRYSSDLLEIAGNFGDVEEQLLAHVDLEYDRDAASYHFIVTTGEWESQMVNTVREISGMAIPQIFCMHNVPKSMGLPITTRRKTNSLSGVFTRPTDPKEFLDVVRGTLPHVETVCLLIGDRDEYGDKGERCTEEQAAIAVCFKRAGMKVLFHHWNEYDPHLLQLEIRAQQSDLFIVFTEPATLANMELLSQVAAEYQVLVAASDLDTVRYGAAIGAGVSGAAFSTMLMDLILDMVLCRRNRLSPPICIPQQPGLHYSYENMLAQGLQLTDEQYALLRMRSINDPENTVYR